MDTAFNCVYMYITSCMKRSRRWWCFMGLGEVRSHQHRRSTAVTMTKSKQKLCWWQYKAHTQQYLGHTYAKWQKCIWPEYKNELCCCWLCGVFELYGKVCGGLIMHRYFYQTTYHIQYQEVTEILVFRPIQHKNKEFFRVVKVEIVRPTFALCDTIFGLDPHITIAFQDLTRMVDVVPHIFYVLR